LTSKRATGGDAWPLISRAYGDLRSSEGLWRRLGQIAWVA
jgi:hypothetical protein